ncbi:MAG: DUF4252 domain-containing protein [Dysgonamonadaceae bacterium]|jgi:hypothetical protein|nr:DUF4252 domain-containing protein [Dysgonamonadaceae bacterium]
MKKTMLSFVFIVALSAQVVGQDVNTMLSKLSKHENVHRIAVGSFGMFFVKIVGGIAGGREALKGMKGIQSLELFAVSDECSAKEKAILREQLQNLKDDREYAMLMQIKKEGDFVRFLIQKEKDAIREMLMVVLSGDDDGGESVVIRLKGHFKESDLAEWVAKNK